MSNKRRLMKYLSTPLSPPMSQDLQRRWPTFDGEQTQSPPTVQRSRSSAEENCESRGKIMWTIYHTSCDTVVSICRWNRSLRGFRSSGMSRRFVGWVGHYAGKESISFILKGQVDQLNLKARTGGMYWQAVLPEVLQNCSTITSSDSPFSGVYLMCTTFWKLTIRDSSLD
jgi:hypothetical protein